jgi:hypothetical protein
VLLVTPSKVNMVVGDAHVFRAVNESGRLQAGVEWFVSPQTAAEVHAGDELEIVAKQTGKLTVTARINGHEADAVVTVIEGVRLPEGSTKWELTELPGKKTIKITPAVPSAFGAADIFVEENGAGGRVIRAVADDGRELWRAGGSEKSPDAAQLATMSPPSQLDTKRKTLCDRIATGMSKDEVRATLADGSGVHLNPAELARPQWTLEEAASGCIVDFDAQGRVSKKKKVLTN